MSGDGYPPILVRRAGENTLCQVLPRSNIDFLVIILWSSWALFTEVDAVSWETTGCWCDLILSTGSPDQVENFPGGNFPEAGIKSPKSLLVCFKLYHYWVFNICSKSVVSFMIVKVQHLTYYLQRPKKSAFTHSVEHFRCGTKMLFQAWYH